MRHIPTVILHYKSTGISTKEDGCRVDLKWQYHLYLKLNRKSQPGWNRDRDGFSKKNEETCCLLTKKTFGQGGIVSPGLLSREETIGIVELRELPPEAPEGAQVQQCRAPEQHNA